MSRTVLRGSISLAAFLAFLAFGWGPPGSAALRAQEEAPIRLVSSSVTSEFPMGFRFNLELESRAEVTTVAVRFRIGSQTAGVYEYLEVRQEGSQVTGELLWRTNTAARYVPPGTVITYNFEIEDAEGNTLVTPQEEFIYHDPRFRWEEISKGPVTVAYHGPVRRRAEIVLDSIVETMETMGPILGADIEEPVRVTMFNNVKEMLDALPPRSASISRELITEGQAFTDVGTLLILGSGRLTRGTASHETMHILTHRAGNSVFRNVPGWLDEGLAELGNLEPGFSYDLALEFALENDRLLPITSLQVLPGNPEDVIIFYGEARSLVRFMVDNFGAEKMKDLMAQLKEGRRIDDALMEVYGYDRIGLENLWRVSIGAKPLERAERARAKPTPVPMPTVLPYSLTPQPQAKAITGFQPTATPTPEATATPAPTPSPTPAATGSAAPEDKPLARASGGSAGEEGQATARGGACGVPSSGTVELSTLLLMVALAGGLRRRR